MRQLKCQAALLTGNFVERRYETVGKGVLRHSLGILPSMRKAYQSDLSDAEWSCLESHLPAPKAKGRPPIYPLGEIREILDAIFYVLRSGSQWRLLPHDFPPRLPYSRKTLYHYIRFWRLDGTWERMHAALLKRVRVRLKRNPSAQRSHRRQSVGQNDRGGRRATRIRWRQEGQRAKTPLAGLNAGFGAQRAGPQRRGRRP